MWITVSTLSPVEPIRIRSRSLSIHLESCIGVDSIELNWPCVLMNYINWYHIMLLVYLSKDCHMTIRGQVCGLDVGSVDEIDPDQIKFEPNRIQSGLDLDSFCSRVDMDFSLGCLLQAHSHSTSFIFQLVF